MNKTLFAAVLILCILSIFLVSCNTEETVKIYVPDGAPALAVANIINDGIVSDRKAAVKICSDNSDYALFTVNVWGLLYVVGWEDVSSLSELRGKSVRSIGMGDTGEWLFKRILQENGVSYDGADGINIQYSADGTEAVGLLMSSACDFALLGEPAATNAINKAKSNGKTLYRVFDLQQLWQEVTASDNAGYPQASVIVKRSLLNENGFADALFQKLSENVTFLTQNAEQLKNILTSAGSLLTVDYTSDIIDRCNIAAVKASCCKYELYDYLSQFNGPFAGMLKDNLYYEFDS